MRQLFIFAVVATACYYLIARAEATRWFWGALDGTLLGSMLRCPACTGFWIGLCLSHIIPTNGHLHGNLFDWSCLITALRHALYGMVLTAITWALMKLALDYGSVPTPEAPDAQADRKADPEG